MVIRTQSAIPAEVKKALAEAPKPKPDIPTLKEMIESHQKAPVEKSKFRKDGKARHTIWLDDEVVEFFKKDGPGWQRRLNEYLRAHVRGL